MVTDIKFKNSTNYKLQNISWRYYIPLLFLALFSAFGPITKRIFFDSTGISLDSFNLNLLYVIPIQLIIITAIIINYFYEKNIQDMSLNLKKFAKRIFDSEPIYIEIYNKCFKELSIYIAWFDRNIIASYFIL